MFTRTGVPRSWPRSCWKRARSKVGRAVALVGRSAVDPVPVTEPVPTIPGGGDVGASGPEEVHADAEDASASPTATVRSVRMTTPTVRPGDGEGRPSGSGRSRAVRKPDAIIAQNGLLPAVLVPGSLDAPTLRRAMTLFGRALREHRLELDSINVFPVADGDTGTNLLATYERVEGALAAGEGDGNLDDLATTIARASLVGARGNSGVILSLALRGLCEGLSAAETPDGLAFAAGLRRASDDAWGAVGRPVEGTILSVLRDAARAAGRAACSTSTCTLTNRPVPPTRWRRPAERWRRTSRTCGWRWQPARRLRRARCGRRV